MIDETTIKKNLNNVLDKTNFPTLGKKLAGKVRDIYDIGEKILFISTDRQSAFDRHLAYVPFKGEVLTQSSIHWFEKTESIVKNHFLDSPDPNIMVGKKLTIFPVEFVVRGFMTGVTSTSVWTAYKSGLREFCGNQLPEGMTKNQAFDKPIITPTTKSEKHDEKITPKEIIEQGLMTEAQWEYCKEKSLALFNFGNEYLKDNNLILVDTKYEFGYDERGEIYLCDEIHTPDSSRFWIKDSYETAIANNQEPKNIDKEFLRLWFKENSDPYKDEKLPDAPEELIVELGKRYITAYEMITQQTFSTDETPILERIENNLKKSGYLK